MKALWGTGWVRVVCVGGMACPCGGTHIADTKELGGVKVEKISSYLLLLTAYFLLTSCLLTSYLPLTSYILLPTAYFLLLTAYILLPTYFLLPIPL